MTRDPDALSISDRVAYAVNQMSVAGYRTIPLVDADRRPVGVVTVTHIIKWMADLFPEAVLNLRPGDALKHPSEVDAGLRERKEKGSKTDERDRSARRGGSETPSHAHPGRDPVRRGLGRWHAGHG